MSSLRLEAPLTVNPSISCQEVVDIMKREGYDQLPAVDDLGCVFTLIPLHIIDFKLYFYSM